MSGLDAVQEKPRILFVDDEPAVLQRVTLPLRRGFDVITATNGPEGLERLRSDPSIAVVISDMRMPDMNGATFLGRVREAAPLVVRMLLTGEHDLATAAAAVNSGQIFRLLIKPCRHEEMKVALDAALEHRRREQVERELLEQTLRGSIKTLVDLLALTNPTAFGRANRIKTRVLELASALELAETWQLEIAALASQLGYIVLSRELCDKLEQGLPLSIEERRLVERAPETAASLLANIPRLEPVCEILASHVRPPRRSPTASGRRWLVELGAHLVRFAIDFDDVDADADTPEDAVGLMRARGASYDPEVMRAFEKVHAARMARIGVREILLTALQVGMVCADDVRLASGALLVTRGYEVTPSFLERVRNFPRGAIKEPLRIITA
jgi:response regulator RpfG family c-di-GMP phosphodiesterase